MQVRAERASDHAAVDELHRLAFGDEGPLVAGVVEALRRRGERYPSWSLVATDGDRVVGHVLFSRALLDAPRRLVEVQVLSPLGVLPDRQGEGIGSALVRHGLELLADAGAPLVFLEGSPGYYPRLGFRPGAALGFRKPSLRIPDAAFQVFPLPACEPWMSGTLVYPEVFWEHDAVGLRDGG